LRLFEWDYDQKPDLEIRYNDLDSLDLVRRVLTDPFEGIGPFCGACEDFGWVITIDVAPTIPLGAVGEALATVWVPCADHAGSWEPEVAGHRWRWVNGTWEPIDTSLPPDE
jgi:hypothetical protein